MLFVFSILAAAGCAACNGTAAILQKVSADKTRMADGVQVGVLWSLVHNWQYNLGVVLDTLGWVLTYIAVQHLPLFFVESIIATNLVITALLERFVLHTPLKKITYAGIFLILAGLVAMAFAATPDSSKHVSTATQWWLSLLPVGAWLFATAVGRLKRTAATIGVALLSGIAFGETSVVGRVFPLPHPLWHAVLNPSPYGLLVSGFVGVLLFSIALQRTHATTVNACMTIMQTFVPSLIGFVVLGDAVRGGRWYDVAIGLTLAVIGTASLAFDTGRRTATHSAAS